MGPRIRLLASREARAAFLAFVLLFGGPGHLAPAFAETDQTTVLGRLTPKPNLGTDGAWTGAVTDGFFRLSAPSAGVVRYYDMPWQGTSVEGRSISVRVDPQGPGSAGLIFRRQPGTTGWFALTARADHHVQLVERKPDALTVVADLDLGSAARADVLLQISDRAGALTLLADGRTVTRLEPVDDRSGLVGIVALSPGNFGFRNFAFGPAIEIAATTSSGGDETLPKSGSDDTVPSASPTPPPPLMNPRDAHIVGAFLGVVFHEFGHFMIGELKLPATGREEDVADEFSAMVYLDNIRNNADSAYELAMGGALYNLMWVKSTKEKDTTPWYDEHAPDKRRLANYMCILYGEYPNLFRSLMDKTGVPEDQREVCRWNAPKHRNAWDTLLRGHRRHGVEPLLVGDLDPSTPGHQITVVYEEPKTEIGKKVQKILKDSRALEMIADSVGKLYVLPRDTKIVVKDCGVVNCWYGSENGSITVCHEMVETISAMFNKYDDTGKPEAGTTPPDGGAPGSETPDGGKTVSIETYLLGTWRSDFDSADGPVATLTHFDRDGTYQAVQRIGTARGNVDIKVTGRWKAEVVGGDTFSLELTPQKWSPKEICASRNRCRRVDLSRVKNDIAVVDDDTMRSPRGEVKRIVDK